MVFTSKPLNSVQKELEFLFLSINLVINYFIYKLALMERHFFDGIQSNRAKVEKCIQKKN